MKTTQGRIAASLLAAAIAIAPAPRAEAFVFHDPVHTIQNILTQMMAYYQRFDEYRAQATARLEQYRHMQQELVKISSFFSSFNLPMDGDLEEVPEDRMVADLCGGGGFSIRSLMGPFTINPQGNILEQQRDVCRRIQIAKNRKYNAAIRFMKDLKPQLESELATLKTRRNSSNEAGNVEASMSDAAAFDNKLKVQFEAWDMQMKGYDGYIASMEDTNRTLARLALKGKPSIVRDLVKTGALKTALDQ